MGSIGRSPSRCTKASTATRESEEAEAGEAEEQFLGKLLGKVLGQEAEYGSPAMPPAQEAELAAQMLEVADEAELDEFLSRIVNTIGRAVQGISGAANSPQGRALIEAVKPLARAALPVDLALPVDGLGGRGLIHSPRALGEPLTAARCASSSASGQAP